MPLKHFFSQHMVQVHACSMLCRSMATTPVQIVLLENGADVNAQGGVYGNAMQAASSRGHEAIIALLLENGANDVE